MQQYNLLTQESHCALLEFQALFNRCPLVVEIVVVRPIVLAQSAIGG